MSEYMSDGPAAEGSLTVAQVTNKILGHLQAGELAPAQRFAQEQLAKGASSDGLDDTAKKRWELTRELLGAAWEIPLPITSALAKGIDGNNPAIAADDCKAFAKSNPEGAAKADSVLAAKAPGIYPYIPNALKAAAAPARPAAAPRPAYFDYSPPPVYTSSSSSTTWPIWVTVGVITLAFVRCAVVSSQKSSYDSYDYDDYRPSYSYDNSFDNDKYQELQRALDDIQKDKDLYGYGGSDSYDKAYDDDYTPPVPAGPPEVPELYTDSDTEDLYSDISTSLTALYRVDMTSDKQQTYLEKLDDAVVDRDCAKMKKYVGQLIYSKPGEDLEYATLGKDHMKAIKKRVDLICKKKAPAKKAAPADEDPF